MFFILIDHLFKLHFELVDPADAFLLIIIAELLDVDSKISDINQVIRQVPNAMRHENLSGRATQIDLDGELVLLISGVLRNIRLDLLVSDLGLDHDKLNLSRLDAGLAGLAFIS